MRFFVGGQAERESYAAFLTRRVREVDKFAFPAFYLTPGGGIQANL